ncbi:hypothetical protein N7535_005604 [Penicillium sp. DV-2018c]|nr:hypothetical protein N7461_009178 [Penicillium sp. DV-2018c]KAJ5571944.1 hypothetical protein N7535_005604 [Penicillium sp. DV-2018c]
MNLLQLVASSATPLRHPTRIAAQNARIAIKRLAEMEKEDSSFEEGQTAEASVKLSEPYVIIVDIYRGSLRARPCDHTLNTRKGANRCYVEVPEGMRGDFEAACKLKGTAQIEALMEVFRRIQWPEFGNCPTSPSEGSSVTLWG